MVIHAILTQYGLVHARTCRSKAFQFCVHFSSHHVHLLYVRFLAISNGAYIRIYFQRNGSVADGKSGAVSNFLNKGILFFFKNLNYQQ